MIGNMVQAQPVAQQNDWLANVQVFSNQMLAVLIGKDQENDQKSEPAITRPLDNIARYHAMTAPVTQAPGGVMGVLLKSLTVSSCTSTQMEYIPRNVPKGILIRSITERINTTIRAQRL